MNGHPLRAALDRLIGPGTEPAGLRVGVDLVHIPRVEALAREHGERWLADHFTAREREQLAAVRGRPMATLAGRLAAKESFVKLLAPARALVLTRDIEVLRGPGGAPGIHPRGTALRELREAGVDRWTVSITHEGDWAIAVAAGLANGPRTDPHPVPAKEQ
ncbi:holo-ACP synthase [Kitasatospora terrestris]|uniref:Holo-[acyl-carrier-protein] synthase n=1 Tax=Kitasatospora terrestris TaxID=258051 RepID=A0ABP9ECX1_9ACTN